MAPFNLLLMVSSCNSALCHEIGHRAHASALATLCFPMQSEKAETGVPSAECIRGSDISAWATAVVFGWHLEDIWSSCAIWLKSTSKTKPQRSCLTLSDVSCFHKAVRLSKSDVLSQQWDLFIFPSWSRTSIPWLDCCLYEAQGLDCCSSRFTEVSHSSCRPSGQIKCVPQHTEIHLFVACIEADQIDEAVLIEGQGPIKSQTTKTLDTTDYVNICRVCVSLVKSGTWLSVGLSQCLNLFSMHSV